MDITHGINFSYPTHDVKRPSYPERTSKSAVMFAIAKFKLQFTMKINDGLFTDFSLNFVPRHNESKIRHITFKELVNIVPSSSSKYKHRRSMSSL